MRHIKISMIALLALALLTGSSSAAEARSVKEQERLLLVLLNAHEYRPNRKLLDRVGKQVNQLLVRISTYRHMRARVRLRALASLAVYPSHRTKQYLLSLFHERSLKKNAVGLLIRRQAIRSAALAFKDGVINDILTLKSDGDAQIREAVAHGLGDTLSTLALPHLRAWLPNERELFVRMAIEKAIKRIKHAPKERK